MLLKPNSFENLEWALALASGLHFWPLGQPHSLGVLVCFV